MENKEIFKNSELIPLLIKYVKVNKVVFPIEKVKYLSNAEVIDELKEKIPNYTKSINLHPLIIDKTDIAIKNCKKLENFHDSIGNIGMCRNPSSEVYKIVETINNKQKAF